ncbi:MAG: farnesyl diphosphate synthase [Pseudomonadota bacterium]
MTAEADFLAFLGVCRQRVEMALESWLPGEGIEPIQLHRAMRYAALGGGKRIRPVLAYAAGRALGLAADGLDGVACTLELIHTYSLVHDDLPAMDNDDWRRGRPTCHRAFDEATAILVGDALQTLAFQILTSDPSITASSEIRLRMVETLARASGSRGMAGGQALDLAATGRTLTTVELENLHIHKTGALIRASVRLVCWLAQGQDTGRTEAIDHYAKCLGLAFQIRDDILDVEGNPQHTGKSQGKDHAQNKATYPALLGLVEARRRADVLCEDALAALADFNDDAEPLRTLARYIVGRDR